MRRSAARQQLGALADALYSAIYHMTPRQRGRAARMLRALTETNCSANLYRLRSTLLGFIDDASSRRERRARARAARTSEAS